MGNRISQALHLRPYLPAPKNAPPHPPFAGGSALEPSRMLLAHRALPSRPERWARLGWKWGERREVGWALLTPPPSKGLLSWLQVEGPERQKQQGRLCAPPPASDLSSFSPWCHLPCMLRALPCCRTFRGSLQAFTRASSKSSQAGVQFFCTPTIASFPATPSQLGSCSASGLRAHRFPSRA